MLSYKLTSPFWDGQIMHARGEVIQVSEESQAPRGSILIVEEEPELDLEPVKEPEPKKK
jgi:hypothetical protein